jgi:ketosteroid isomerase-like protein
MQTITRMLLPALLVLVAVGSAMADMKDDVAAAYTAWDAAFNKADAKAVAAFYLPEAKVLPPTHTVVSGPAEIEKFFAGFFANGVKSHALKLIEAGGADKMGYGTANWSAADKDGKPLGGIATHIFERQGDGSLKLKIHTFN